MKRYARRVLDNIDDITTVLKHAPKHATYLIAFFSGIFTLAMVFSGTIIELLKSRAPISLNFMFNFPDEIFMNVLKIAFLTASYFIIPLIIYFLPELFPAKGSQKRQKAQKVLTHLYGASVAGVLVGWYLLIQVNLYFLMGFSIGVADLQINISKYISFCLAAMLISGLVFLFPAVYYLKKKNMFYPLQKLSAYRKKASGIVLLTAAVIFFPTYLMSALFYALWLFVLYKIALRLLHKS